MDPLCTGYIKGQEGTRKNAEPEPKSVHSDLKHLTKSIGTIATATGKMTPTKMTQGKGLGQASASSVSSNILLGKSSQAEAAPTQTTAPLIPVPLGPLEAVLIAAQSGNLQLVQRMLARTPNLNIKDQNGRTVLHHAMQGLSRARQDKDPEYADACRKIINLLLTYQLDITVCDCEGKTVFSLAKELGERKIMKLIKQYMEMYEEFGSARLMQAIGRGDVNAVRALIRAGLDVSQPRSPTALKLAIQSEYPEEIRIAMVQELLQSDDVNINAEQGEALVCAIKRGYDEIVGLLLNAHADIDIRQVTACLQENQNRKIQEMIENRRKLDQRLMMALVKAPIEYRILLGRGERDYQGEVKQLLKAGAFVLLTIPLPLNCDTVLHKTIRLGWEEEAKMFIKLYANEKWIDCCKPESDGQTALMLAAQQGQIGIVSALLDAGARINAKDQAGKTALMHTIVKGDMNMIHFLIAQGARLNVKDCKGNSILTYLIHKMSCFEEEEAALEETMMNLIRDIVARHPHLLEDDLVIRAVTIIDKPGILKLLLDLGANVHAHYEGMDVLDYAINNGCIAAAKVLVSHKMRGRMSREQVTETVRGLFYERKITPLMIEAITGDVPALKKLLEARASPNVQDYKGRSALLRALQANQMEAVKMLIKHGAEPNIRDQDGHFVEVFKKPEGSFPQGVFYRVSERDLIDNEK